MLNNQSGVNVTLEELNEQLEQQLQRDKKCIGSYIIGKTTFWHDSTIEKSIGEGTFGKVKLGTH